MADLPYGVDEVDEGPVEGRVDSEEENGGWRKVNLSRGPFVCFFLSVPEMAP